MPLNVSSRTGRTMRDVREILWNKQHLMQNRVIVKCRSNAKPLKGYRLSSRIALVVLAIGWSWAQEEISAPAQTDGTATRLFAEQVRTVLETQCLICHGGKFKQAGLTVATREGLLRGSDNGPVVIPGNARASLLVKKIRHEHEPGMPYQRNKL